MYMYDLICCSRQSLLYPQIVYIAIHTRCMNMHAIYLSRQLVASLICNVWSDIVIVLGLRAFIGIQLGPGFNAAKMQTSKVADVVSSRTFFVSQQVGFSFIPKNVAAASSFPAYKNFAASTDSVSLGGMLESPLKLMSTTYCSYCYHSETLVVERR